jgi:predicted PolB exonuclease-like 3'-5' exonuclease
MTITPTPLRRNAFADIETVALDPSDTKGALSAITGRIVCACLLFDDGKTIQEETHIDRNEESLLRSFWSSIRRTDVFIGHNVFGFDMPFIRQRSWILGVRPSRRVDLRRFYTADIVDSMQLWSNWGATKFVSLDALGAVLGVGVKTGHGDQVAGWWAKDELDRIASYCRDDVRLSYRVFCRLMFQQLPERYVQATDLYSAAKPLLDSEIKIGT